MGDDRLPGAERAAQLGDVTCSAFAAVAGGSSPHRTSIRCDGRDRLSRCASSSAASSARCLAAVQLHRAVRPDGTKRPEDADSIALPMPYRELTGHPKDGGVLAETDHLRESRHMNGACAFCLTHRRGGIDALAPHLTHQIPSEGEPHAHAPLVEKRNPDRPHDRRRGTCPRVATDRSAHDTRRSPCPCVATRTPTACVASCLVGGERRARWFFAAHLQGGLGAAAGYVALAAAYERIGSAWAATAVLVADLLPAMLLGPLLGGLSIARAGSAARSLADV